MEMRSLDEGRGDADEGTAQLLQRKTRWRLTATAVSW